jgi:phenylacetate-coenzyme A ligase PaaK-like adenylate-forming protein
MPASAPAVASSPAHKALPIIALTTGTSGRKKPIAMQAREVRRRKTAFAATWIAPRLPATARRLAYQRSAKATIVAAMGMNDLLFSL